MVVEVQQLENRIFWCGFGFHQDFCIDCSIAVKKCNLLGPYKVINSNKSYIIAASTFI